MKKWIFFLHNFIEPNHYAIAECVNEMMRSDVAYTFVCKRILDNALARQYADLPKIQLADLPAAESFWQEYDGVHVVYDGKPSLALCALAYTYDIPYVITFHGGYDTNEKIFHTDVREKTVWLCNHASAVSVVCLKDKQALMDIGVREENIHLVAPPINNALLAQARADEEDVYGITVVGRLIPKKGVEYALQALQKLPCAYHLDVIGDGELLPDMQRLSKELGVDSRVVWHGQLPLEQTLRIMAKNRLFWHPSIVADDGNADGIPQVILYAMALGRCVIASDESHIGELVQTGENGFLFPAKNAQDLADITQRSSLCCGIGGCARKSVTAFSLERQKGIYRSIYRLEDEV